VASEPNSVDDLENAADQGTNGEVNRLPAETGGGQAQAVAEAGVATGPDDAGARGAAPPEPTPPEPTPPEPTPPEPTPPELGPGEPEPAAGELLVQVAAATQEIAAAANRYHARAEQREGVIDYLRSELDQLRRGERRGLLRPVLAELCRLRDDLLKQAATLPVDFSADQAADLLRSYAETIELTLENNGVVTYAPDSGDPFNPRLHRRISGAPTADPALAGHVAGIQRDGYLDIEANSPIAPAEVSVYAVTTGEQEQ
jgi:molecular chaperone GrpE (heat shock protein)